MKKISSAIGALLLLTLAAEASAERILVAVAANFAAPMGVIAEAFEEATGHQVDLSTGSSGRFFAQIQNGAPFQLFFSADQAKPAALEAAGLSVAGSRFTYAVGSLVLWSAQPDRVTDGPAVLRQAQFTRLALANPRLAPYGQAAVEVLDTLGIAEASRSRWVLGENIAQTYQFVSTGNAELGFVALSQLQRGATDVGEAGRSEGSFAQGSGWIVPQSLHEPIRQDGVLLHRGAGCQGCVDFLAFIRTPQVQTIIEDYGYRRPQ